jgi:integrase
VIEKTEDGKKIAIPVEEMKTKSSRRTLPLIPVIADALREQQEKQEAWKKLFKRSYNREFTDFVCINQLGELMHPDYVTDRFKRLLRKYNLRQIRFHDLRHTCASLLLKNGMQLIHIKDYLGHSEIGITANIYAHLDESSKAASADVMQSSIYSGKSTD